MSWVTHCLSVLLFGNLFLYYSYWIYLLWRNWYWLIFSCVFWVLISCTSISLVSIYDWYKNIHNSLQWTFTLSGIAGGYELWLKILVWYVFYMICALSVVWLCGVHQSFTFWCNVISCWPHVLMINTHHSVWKLLHHAYLSDEDNMYDIMDPPWFRWDRLENRYNNQIQINWLAYFWRRHTCKINTFGLYMHN